MSGRSIIRVQRTVDNPWVQVHRDTARDASLSWAARGMLTFILSHPDDWTITNKYLERASPAGREATDKIIAELKRAGYMHREQVKAEKGRIEWQTTVYELPVLKVSPSTALPSTGNPCMAPSTALPSTGNPCLYEQVTNERMNEEGVDMSTPPDLIPSDTAPANALVVSSSPTRATTPASTHSPSSSSGDAAAPAADWTPFFAPVAFDLTGREGAWRNSRVKSKAVPLAVYGQLAGVFGAATGNDPIAALALWRAFVADQKATKFHGSGDPLWRRVTKANVVDIAGRWIADRGPSTAANGRRVVSYYGGSGR